MKILPIDRSFQINGSNYVGQTGEVIFQDRKNIEIHELDVSKISLISMSFEEILRREMSGRRPLYEQVYKDRILLDIYAAHTLLINPESIPDSWLRPGQYGIIFPGTISWSSKSSLDSVFCLILDTRHGFTWCWNRYNIRLWRGKNTVAVL